VIAQSGPAFWECPPPMCFTFSKVVKHKAKFILNQTYVDQEAYEWEGSYAYSIVGGFLHL
jgi:hypothetical protein